MAEFPALPLFTDSLLADTSHLSHEEFGAYMRVLILIWRTPECRIPVADAWLMRKLACDESNFNRLFKPLFLEYLTSDGTYYRQNRLSKEFEYLRNQRVKNRGAAKSRWDKEKDPCKRNAPHPTPPHQPLREEVDTRTRGSPLEIGMDFEKFWSAYPKKSGRKAAFTAYEQARGEGIDHARIIEGVSRYAAFAHGTEERFLIPPDRWLRDGHWDDVHPAKPEAGKPHGKPAYGDTIKTAAADAVRNLEQQEEIRKKARQG